MGRRFCRNHIRGDKQQQRGNQLGSLGIQGSQPFDLQSEVHDYNSRNVEARA